MSKEICISSTPHETRLAIIEDEQLTEVYYERENEYTLAGSIYKGRVTRVLPGMQSAFVDVGLERDAFLYVTDFLEEQEDSAEFEPLATGEGQPDNARFGREQRPNANREGKAFSAGPRGSESPAPKEASSDSPETGEAADTARRWRGRRSRRGRGFRPPEQREAQREAAASGTIAPGQEPTQSPVEEKAPRLPSPEAPPQTPVPVLSFLPGESISKYGRQSAGEASQQISSAQPKQEETGSFYKPSTLIDAPIHWSGVGLLPGESRSKPSRSSFPETGEDTLADSIAPERAEEAQFAQDPIAHDAINQDPTNQDAVNQDGSGQDQTVDSHMEASGNGAASLRPLAEGENPKPALANEPVLADDPMVQPAAASSAGMPSAPPPPVESAAVATPQEFEPAADASASYRVDPAAPSELRVGGMGLEDQRGEASEVFPAIPEIERHFEEGQSGRERGDRSATPADEIGAFDEEDEEGRDEVEDFLDAAHEHSLAASLIEEEEMGDEEDFEFLPLYPHEEQRGLGAEHEFEEMEEETLDEQTIAGAQIDELVRDSHIERSVEEGLGDESMSDEEEASLDREAEAEKTASPIPIRQERQDPRHAGRVNRNDPRRRHNGRRQSAQSSDLPVISELLKQGQEILVQIAKEPIAKKGARITSHIALPGRFLVFMPTVNHIGVSRKISSDSERQRLKKILSSEKGNGGGFIVRTAADGASEEELRADIRFLINLWTEIKQRADAAKAPALIYHDLNVVERILRDQVSESFSTIWVDSEMEYERIVRFLNRFQPSLVRRVKLYTKDTPLFEQFGVQEEIGKALKSKVWLKSGGSIVINQTEALVAIDINTGKYVGRTARLEDTILKTNLDAIPEIARQIRLRDLGGIIVIDFIDMDERKNRHKVMQALEEALKADRAPTKVLQFNDFGLVAITRKRVKQSLERTLCVPCAICSGTGMTKSPTTVCNEIYVEMRKMQKSFDRGDVLLRVNPEVVKTLKGNNARWLAELEEMSGKTVIVKSDPALNPEQFDIH